MEVKSFNWFSPLSCNFYQYFKNLLFYFMELFFYEKVEAGIKGIIPDSSSYTKVHFAHFIVRHKLQEHKKLTFKMLKCQRSLCIFDKKVYFPLKSGHYFNLKYRAHGI
ncbi:hypothetical protein BLX87_16985 [Bacillus sp. VT-16-64]|nr:hypothetical protein BLX87_16985 [Bacillus sp. VT-16-64]